MKSSASIDHEIDRHLRHSSFVLHPFSRVKLLWNLFMTFFTLISLILVPFLLTFFFHQQQDWIYLFLAINLVFFIDIILNFFTGYFDSTTGAVFLERKISIQNYLKTFFLLDFLSGFPFEVIHVVWRIFNPEGEVDWYWTSSNILKIVRMRNLLALTRQLFHMYKISCQKAKIIEMLMILIIFLHWATCLELYIPLAVGRVAQETTTSRSWLSSDYMKKRDTIFKRYISSLNRATTALMSSSHYLHVNTTEDIILNLFLTILGRIGFIYILAQLLQLMTTFDSTKKRNVREVQQFYEYMKHKELPHSIQQRVFKYYEYYQRNIEPNKLIISQVSPNLRQELLLHEYKEMIEKVNLLRQLPQAVLSQVLAFVKSEIFLPNEAVVKSGTLGDSLFYISCGTVSVTKATGEELLQLSKGSHFGEVSLISEHERRHVDVTALELCEISVLKRSDFLSILSSHVNLLNKLQRFTLTRLER